LTGNSLCGKYTIVCENSFLGEFNISSSGGRGEIRTLGTVTHTHP